MRKAAGRRKGTAGRVLAVVTVIALAVAMFAAGADAKASGATTGTGSGPSHGGQGVISKEEACIKHYAANPANNYVNWWPAIGAPEHTDAIHSGTMPCATFTGKFNGPNQVLQQVSPQGQWPDVQFVVFDGPRAGYLQGGGLATDTGQFVAKFDPLTGKQVWKTTLINVYAHTPVQWIAFGSMGILKNGYLYAAAGPHIWKLDRATGKIVADAPLTVLGMPAIDGNYDGFGVAPDANGTILLKTQTRPVGCPTQGNQAMQSCQAKYGPQPDTTVVAVDPNTLKTLAAIKLTQEASARPIITKHSGKIYMYLSGTRSLLRVIWNPATRTLTQDSSWAPDYLLKGQTVGDAPALIGNWVIPNENGLGGSVPICVVAISQDNVNDLHRLCPWGSTLPAGVPESASPASFGTDPQNSMVYAQDLLVNGVFGIRLNQQTGALTVVWSRPDWRTSDYFSLEGPQNKRVLISQYLNPNVQLSQISSANYTESLLWANAATGKTIAQSAYNPSTAQGSLPNLGYGGRVYMMGNNGLLYIYEAVK